MSKSPTAVVTGGTRGIGKVIVDTLLANGYRVGIVARKKPKSLPSETIFFQADVRDFESVMTIHKPIRNSLGHIDLWVNCAGYGKALLFDDPADWSDWDDIVQANFWGVVYCCRVVSDLLIDRSVVINIASLAALMAPKALSAYSTSKAAVVALTRSLAVDWASRGIRVCAIAPGPVDTQGFRDAGGDPANRAKTIPLGRMVQETEIAAACLYLAKNAPSQTGNVMVIDGGSSSAGCYV